MRFHLILCFSLCIALQLSSQEFPSGPFVCPPCNNSCDAAEFNQPGVCPHCNMVLIPEDRTKTIAFYLQDGVELLDFAGPMEVFSYAGYEVITVSKDRRPIQSQGILTVLPDYTLENAPEADILAFFGGNSIRAYGDSAVIRWIRNRENVDYHFSVCTGVFMLAEAGLLDGKSATTFRKALSDLERNYPEIEVKRGVRFVDNGRIITTAGISAGIDGALHLVAKLQGYNAARRVAYHIEYDRWQPGNGLLLSSQNPYQATLPMNALRSFRGRYEHPGGRPVLIEPGPNGLGLAGTIGNSSFPIFHEREDIFSDPMSQAVIFVRNEQGDVIGYRRSPGGTLFRKLNGTNATQ